MNTIPAITNKDIKTQSQKFLTAMQTAKAIQADLDAFWTAAETEMRNHSITSIKGDWGSLNMAQRKNWRADSLPPRFYKQILDTAKLNAFYKSGVALPKGASFEVTTYLSKRIK